MIGQRSRWNGTDLISVVDEAGKATRKPYFNLLDRRVQAFADDIPYRCKPRDTFSHIAFKACGDSFMWWAIAEANGVIDPWADMKIFQNDGVTLRVPSVQRLNFEYLDFER